MSAPCFSTTGDDGRFYNWPLWPGRHDPSITTVIKQGVPKPTISKWENKKVAFAAIENLDLVIALKERAHADA